MFKKILFFGFCLLTTAWIFYVVSTLTDWDKTENYLSYFTLEDEAVVAIHHPEDFDINELGINVNGQNLKVFGSIRSKLPRPSSVFMSKTRSILTIEISEKWNHSLIRKVFGNGIFPLVKTGLHSFNFGNLKGQFKDKQLVLFAKDLKLTKLGPAQWQVDTQSSFSVVQLKPNLKITDSYCKEDRRISYQKEQLPSSQYSLVDDRSVFSEFVPNNTSEYAFFEKHYLSYSSPQFKKSLFSQLAATGVVFLTVDGLPLAVFDVKADDFLIPSLNDHFKMKETNSNHGKFPSFYIGPNFPENPEALYVHELDGFGLISTERKAIDHLLSDIELNKTMSTDAIKFELFNKELPQKVSHRYINSNKHQSSSWINTNLLSVDVQKVGLGSLDGRNNNINNYFTMNPGEEVKTFCALSGRGNVILSTESNLFGYKNGSQKWRQELLKPLVQAPFVLDLDKEGAEHIVLQYEDQIMIIDKMGREISSFTGKFMLPILSTKYKNDAVLLCPNGAEISMLNTNGTVQKKITFTGNIESIHLGIEQKGAVCGVICSDFTYTLNVNAWQRNDVKLDGYKTIDFSNDCQWIAKKGNEVHFFEKNEWNATGLNGNWRYAGNIKASNHPQAQLFYNGLNLAMVEKGKVIWRKILNCQEITKIGVFNGKKQPTTFYILDGIENKVYLFDEKGVKMDQEDRPAHGEVQMSSFGEKGQSITTFLGNFLIQFNR